MSDTVSCECGARIRLPEGANGRAVRCPRCKAVLATTPASGIVVAPVSSTGTEQAACPICQTSIAEGELVVPCPECRQVHHRECWTEVGGCGTYGCKHAPTLAKNATDEDGPRAAWGDTKQCPACHETIKAIALRCRYCGTDFDTVDPLSVFDLHDQEERFAAQRRTRATVTTIFALSVIGCIAPLMLLVNLVWVLRNRRDLAKAGPVYLILGYSALVLSVVYSVLMLGFYLFSEF